jgi:hypothetical protein
MTFNSSRLENVIHLAEQVYEQDGFVVEVFQSMHLFFVEVVHFRRSYYLVVSQVDYRKPVLQGTRGGLVFFRKHEPDEVLVAHFVGLTRLKFPRYLLKYSVHGFARQSMAFIPGKVFFIYQEIMVSIQLPEAAVEHVEMLIREVLSNFIDIFFVGHLPQYSL